MVNSFRQRDAQNQQGFTKALRGDVYGAQLEGGTVNDMMTEVHP